MKRSLNRHRHRQRISPGEDGVLAAAGGDAGDGNSGLAGARGDAGDVGSRLAGVSAPTQTTCIRCRQTDMRAHEKSPGAVAGRQAWLLLDWIMCTHVVSAGKSWPAIVTASKATHHHPFQRARRSTLPRHQASPLPLWKRCSMELGGGGGSGIDIRPDIRRVRAVGLRLTTILACCLGLRLTSILACWSAPRSWLTRLLRLP